MVHFTLPLSKNPKDHKEKKRKQNRWIRLPKYKCFKFSAGTEEVCHTQQCLLTNCSTTEHHSGEGQYTQRVNKVSSGEGQYTQRVNKVSSGEGQYTQRVNKVSLIITAIALSTDNQLSQLLVNIQYRKLTTGGYILL